MNSPLTIVDLDTAPEFLNYLQPRESRWRSSDDFQSDWLFRGQRDSEWKLLPRAHRGDIPEFRRFKLEERAKVVELLMNFTKDLPYSRERLEEVMLQTAAELRIVQDFIDIADRTGQIIPENSPVRFPMGRYSAEILKDSLNNLARDTLDPFPVGFGSVEFSIAQHHGIPTRCLDWSYSPFVAAYFALEDAFEYFTAKGVTPNQRLSVWAIRFTCLSLETDNDKYASLELITQRRRKIEYMGAQGGLLVYDRQASRRYLQHGLWIAFEDILQEKYQHEVDVIRKVTLPISEAVNALKLLMLEGITRAHLMPTWDNVASTLKLQQKLMGF